VRRICEGVSTPDHAHRRRILRFRNCARAVARQRYRAQAGLITLASVYRTTQVARVLRSATLDVAERDFVKAVELLGLLRSRDGSEILRTS